MKDQLFLMQPGFVNAGLGPFYCGDSVSVEGMLSFFPDLRTKVDIHYIAFPRPRTELVELLGEDNQAVPVLILGDESAGASDVEPKQFGSHRFLSDEKKIRQHLSDKFGLPQSG